MSELQFRYRKTLDVNARVSHAPVTLEWNHAMMIRSHSLRSAVKEVLNANQSLDLVRINVIGPPSTGKTTLADVIGHLGHTMAKIPYTVRKFKRDDLMDMKGTLATLTPTNTIMEFDDLSWLESEAGKKQILKIQKEFTEIRHLPGGQDIKIILITNFHYSFAIPKPLRQAEFFAVTSIGSNEMDNMEKTFGRKWVPKIKEFEQVVQESLMGEGTEADPKTFSYPLGNKGKRFVYPYKNPFAPALWWNRRSLRHIVFPKRTWIDPVCAICSGATLQNETDELELIKLRDEMKTISGDEYITAARLKLYQLGINSFPKNVQTATKHMEEYMKNRTINPETFMKVFKLKPVRTHLARKPVFERMSESNVTE